MRFFRQISQVGGVRKLSAAERPGRDATSYVDATRSG
jgi:hypothetical protein